jgi:hypothetical protein
MHRNVYLNGTPAFVLGLRKPKAAILRVLRAKANYILTSASGVEQQRHRKARSRANREVSFEPRHVVQAP